MKKMISVLSVIALVAVFTAQTSLADDCPASKSKKCSAGEKQDIVDTAVGAGSFKTLVTAVSKAGLVETLKGKGPFTVFAPTDEAFAKLPAGTVQELIKPENRDKLTAILTYHVVPGKVMAADVVKLSSAETVQGSSVDIKVGSSPNTSSTVRIREGVSVSRTTESRLGSQPTCKTRPPLRAKHALRLVATTDLPMPPLPYTAIFWGSLIRDQTPPILVFRHSGTRPRGNVAHTCTLRTPPF